jgi:hypothetical protein
MLESSNKPKTVDQIKHDLENTALSLPEWALDHHSLCNSNNSGNTPKSIIELILEAIAHSIENVLAEFIARCVAEGVEQKIRPLVDEIAILRSNVEQNWKMVSHHDRNKSLK